MNRPLSRRGFIGLGAVATSGAVLPSVAGCSLSNVLASAEPGALIRSAAPLPAAYDLELTLPPVLQPSHSERSTDHFDLTQTAIQAELLPALSTPMWTYNGSFPGPTIESRAGRRTVVRHTNILPTATVTHLHGGHTPHEHDGYPADLLLPREVDGNSNDASGLLGHQSVGVAGPVARGSRAYDYPLDQRGAMLWYHDHRHGFTGPSVWRGLAGMHIVRDDDEARLPLPSDDYELPLMITDRSFDAEGRMPYPSLDLDGREPGVTPRYMNGVLGDVLLVNGVPWPRTTVTRSLYRLRLLNASNARRYDLFLDPTPNAEKFVQIGTDGGLLDRPRRRTSITLASAERADVLVDFSGYPAGTRVQLRNRLGRGRTAQVMAFDVDGARVEAHATIPETLVRLERLDPSRAVVTRTFLFQNHGSKGWLINGAGYDPRYPLAFPKLGHLERWRFVTDLHHPIHLHLNHFQVISRNDKPPGPGETGWKDTLDLLPAESAEIVVRFDDYAGRFVFHCHNLEHEDMAMMADFVTY